MGCTHRDGTENFWKRTGNEIGNIPEYICTNCGLVHLPTLGERATGIFHPDPIELVPEEYREQSPYAFEALVHSLFDKRITILHKKIKQNTAGYMTFPKKYIGCDVSVIIWNREIHPFGGQDEKEIERHLNRQS